MTSSYAVYDASKPQGHRSALGADYTMRGFDQFNSLIASVEALTGGVLVDPPPAPAVTDLLIGGDFGAFDSANAVNWYKALFTVKYWRDNLTAGGFFTALAKIDKGIS